MKAIIMAGGEGSRLRPLTCELPKPLVPLLGRPIMRYAVELLKKHNIYDIAATVAYKAKMIEDEFKGELHCFKEEVPLGTAGSVKMCSEFLDGGSEQSFLVISGDALTDLDISAAVKFHKEKEAFATLVLKRVPNPLEYGVVHCGKNGRIKRFVEKPDWGGVISDTVNTGIYILDKRALNYIPEGKYDFGKELFPKLVAMGQQVYGYVSQDYWCDVGDIATYMSAQRDMLFGRVNVAISSGALPDFIFNEGAVMETPCYIGKGTVISSGAKIGEGSVVGDKVHVGKNAIIENAVIWDGARIGDGAMVSGCVVQSGAVIGKNASVHVGAVLGEGAAVGEEVVVYPGVKLWPLAVAEDGARVKANITQAGNGGLDFSASALSGLISSDDTAVFAASFASALGVERLCIAHDKSPAAAMLALAAVSAAVSVGSRVFNCGEAELPALLFSSMQKNGDGCLHISVVDGFAKIRALHNNAFLDPGQMKKVQQTCQRCDFSRQPYEAVKEIIRDSSVQECYDVWKKALLSGRRAPVYGDARGMDAVLYDENGGQVDEHISRNVFEEASEHFTRRTHGMMSVYEMDGDLRIGILSKYLAESGLSQRDMLHKHGGGYASLAIDCPDRLKGAAMRRLLEQYEDRAVAGRGVTIKEERGIANIMPGEKQQIQLFVSAASQEYAAEIMADLSKLTGELLREIDDGEQ
ncbi:MAG: sugar phosphate nucleotidyltransferase [Christensenellales bacterium]